MATLTLLVVACGSDEVASTPTPPVEPTTAATLPPPTVLTLDKMSPEFWQLRGFGSLREIPEKLLATSPQLDDETLVVEWTNFLGGTALIDWVTLLPFAEFCSDGTFFGGDAQWVVEPLNESTVASANAVGGNAVSVPVFSGNFKSNRNFGARDGLLVNASDGLHKTEGEITGNDPVTRFATLDSLNCD